MVPQEFEDAKQKRLQRRSFFSGIEVNDQGLHELVFDFVPLHSAQASRISSLSKERPYPTKRAQQSSAHKSKIYKLVCTPSV